MAKGPRENRIPIMMSDEELRTIDDWRFKNRIGTRSEAVRRLARIGAICDSSIDKLKDDGLAAFEEGDKFAAVATADYFGQTHDDAEWGDYPEEKRSQVTATRLLRLLEKLAATTYGIGVLGGRVLVVKTSGIDEIDVSEREAVEFIRKRLENVTADIREALDALEQDK